MKEVVAVMKMHRVTPFLDEMTSLTLTVSEFDMVCPKVKAVRVPYRFLQVGGRRSSRSAPWSTAVPFPPVQTVTQAVALEVLPILR